MSLQVALQWTIDAALGVGVALIWLRLGEPSRAVRRARAQWLELELEVSGVLEKLGTWAAREAKRQSRAAQRDLSEQPAAVEAGAADNHLDGAQIGTGTRHRKAALWDRARNLGHAANIDRGQAVQNRPAPASGQGGNGSGDN